MRRGLSLLFLLAFTALRLDASCGSASCPIDLHALNRPMKGQFTFDFSLQYIDQDQPRILTRRARVGEIPSDHDELRTINRAATLGLTYGIWYSYSVFFVALLRDFGWSRSVLAGAFSLFVMVHGLSGPVLGWLVERF